MYQHFFLPTCNTVKGWFSLEMNTSVTFLVHDDSFFLALILVYLVICDVLCMETTQIGTAEKLPVHWKMILFRKNRTLLSIYYRRKREARVIYLLRKKETKIGHNNNKHFICVVLPTVFIDKKTFVWITGSVRFSFEAFFFFLVLFLSWSQQNNVKNAL